MCHLQYWIELLLFRKAGRQVTPAAVVAMAARHDISGDSSVLFVRTTVTLRMRSLQLRRNTAIEDGSSPAAWWCKIAVWTLSSKLTSATACSSERASMLVRNHAAGTGCVGLPGRHRRQRAALVDQQGRSLLDFWTWTNTSSCRTPPGASALRTRFAFRCSRDRWKTRQQRAGWIGTKYSAAEDAAAPIP